MTNMESADTMVPDNKWTWRRVLIYLSTMISLGIVGFISYKSENANPIALALIGYVALIHTSYVWGATAEYVVQITKAVSEGIVRAKDNIEN